MKKFVPVCLSALFFTSCFAPSQLTSTTDGTVATTTGQTATTTETGGGLLGGLLSSVIGAITGANQVTIVGEWQYTGSAFDFESDNALASVGSGAVESQVASKADSYLAKVGIKPGACHISFQEDGACVFTAGTHVLNGTYQYDAQTASLNLAFGMAKVKASVELKSNNLHIVFPADSLLNILKTASGLSGDATIKLISTVLSAYNGLNVGMAFTR